MERAMWIIEMQPASYFEMTAINNWILHRLHMVRWWCSSLTCYCLESIEFPMNWIFLRVFQNKFWYSLREMFIFFSSFNPFILGKCELGDAHYALLGDCQRWIFNIFVPKTIVCILISWINRYVSCRNGRPILFKCESTLYFDYILQVFNILMLY